MLTRLTPPLVLPAPLRCMETFHAFRASMNYCIEWRALALHPSDANRNQLLQEVAVTQFPALLAKVGLEDLILPLQGSLSPWHWLSPPIPLPLSSHAISRSLLNGALPSFQAICSFDSHPVDQTPAMEKRPPSPQRSRSIGSGWQSGLPSASCMEPRRQELAGREGLERQLGRPPACTKRAQLDSLP